MPLLNDYLALGRPILVGPFLHMYSFALLRADMQYFRMRVEQSNGKELLELEQKPFHFSINKNAVS